MLDIDNLSQRIARLEADNALLTRENALLERRLKVASDAFNAANGIVSDLWADLVAAQKRHETVYGTVQIEAGTQGAEIYYRGR